MAFSDSDDIDDEKQKKKQKQNAKKSSDTESSVAGTKYRYILQDIYNCHKSCYLVFSIISQAKTEKKTDQECIK